MLDVTSAFSIGTGGSVKQYVNQKSYQVTDDLTLVRGRHELGMGGTVSYWVSDQLINGRSVGNFTFNGSPAGKTLNFSNYVDDGAVFYLNGAEIQRLRMPDPPQVIMNTTLTTGGACGVSEATCPDLFSISGLLVATNLHSGDNVLAVEVHQVSTASSDIVFGSALSYSQPATIRPTLNLLREDNHLTLQARQVQLRSGQSR